MKIKLSDFVAAYIKKYTNHVFLLPGGGNMHLVDSFGKEPGLNVVSCLHEQAVAIAADGYAQYSNGIGVALVTTGPGGTNTVTGVAGSWVESVPLVVISGQVKTSDIKKSPKMRILGLQEIDIVSIVSSITKYAVTVTEPNSILFHLEKAVFLARSGRPGPVWIDIPLDVQAAIIDIEKLEKFDSPDESTEEINSADLKSKVAKTLQLLAKSKRPVLFIGNGVRLAHCDKIFREVIQKLNVPLLTTWKASDLLSMNHPLFYGRPGTVAQRGANFIQQNSDFILSLGCRLDFGQIGYAQDTFAREARKVIVDIDPIEFTKFKFAIDEKIQINVKDFLDELFEQLKTIELPRWHDWHERCKKWKEHYPVVLSEYRSKSAYVSTYVLVETLSKIASSQDIIIPCSSGSGADIISQSFSVKEGQRILNSPGFGAMGFGIPQSIGACIASGNKRTICINGDGGFQLNIQELETIKRLNLPVKFFYLNNQGYLSIRATQKNYFEGRLVASGVASGLTLPDIQKIGSAYGIASNKIFRHSDLEKCIQQAFLTDGPFICEVMVDPEEEVAPKVKSALTASGKMISKPLEDLAPFLDRKEFMDNMIIKPLDE
jgi:acetolactate synthase-1/2/3 large subunit